MFQRAGVGRPHDLLGRPGLHVGGGVNVGFNPTGCHDASGGIDALDSSIDQGAGSADGDDASVLNSDVHLSGLAGHDDCTAGD